MNSAIKYVPESLTDHRAFTEHILSIIDTKLQFVEYNTSALIAEHTNQEKYFAQPPPLLKETTPVLAPSTITDKVFSQIEQYSKTTCLLLILRSSLCGKNASLIYELLTDNQFLNFRDEELQKMMEKSLH